ncbi:MAG: MFS transporter [Ilumatobacteraceae bacterium]
MLGSIAFALLGGVHQIWQVYAVYTLLGLGFSFAGLLPATTVVTRWFHAKRSTALSIASTGLSAGGVLITPAVKWALDRNGLSATTPWLAVLWFVGIVPLTLAWMKPDPTVLGWMPDGIRLDRTVSAPALTGTPYDRAVRSRFFIAITIGYVFVLGSQVGGIQHLVKMVEERAGSGRATAATSILAMSSIVARLIGGQVAAKVPLARLTFGFAAVQGLSLLLASQAMSVPAIFGSVSLFGLTVGNLLMLQPLLIGQRFGVKDYARIFSRSQFTHCGYRGGPYLLGFLHDHGGVV